MNPLKPIIKSNDGYPIALCNRCYCIICYVKCVEEENCIVLEPYKNNTKKSLGSQVPVHCDGCEKLLSYSLNE